MAKRTITITGEQLAGRDDIGDIEFGGVVTITGDFEFEVEDLDRYVQVRVGSSTSTYTYRDPSDTLLEGDHVVVPFGYSNNERLGTVKSIGRGSYKGVVKDVLARLESVRL